MRRTGPLILIVIVGILGLLGSSWFARQSHQRRTALHIPRALPPGTESTAQEWSFQQMNGNKPKAEIHAKDFKEISTTGRLELQGVELDLYTDNGAEYNKVTSSRAEFDPATSTMYSEGDVSMTMGLPVDKHPTDRIMTVTSSGVHFETKTGRAWTDRPATFRYQAAEGTAVGVSYEPQTRELLLKSQANLVWRGKTADTPPMHIEAGQVIYRQSESKVFLSPWSKLVRGTLTMNAGAAVVVVDKEHVRGVDAANAVGVDNQPDRRMDYAADHLVMDFDNQGRVQHMVGDGKARMAARTPTGDTTVTSDHADLVFAAGAQSNTVQKALATGHAVVESAPAAPPNGNPSPKRVLKSDVIRAVMRPGGNDLENIETGAPGTLEFIPVRSDQPYRILHGTQMWIRYGPSNQIEAFRSVNVATRTEHPKEANAKTAPPPTLTWSQELNASFEPRTGQPARIEQTKDFRFEDGDRRGSADKAVLDQPKNVITLTGSARVADSTGMTTAKQIVMDRNSGDVLAEGNVNSTRNSGKGDVSMLSGNEPVHARSRRMTAVDDNTLIRYEGDAVAWQGADRIQADTLEIDRDKNKLTATGHVITQLPDQKESDAPKKRKKAAAAFTTIRAPLLIYTDDNRLAYYSGGVVMERPDMTMKSRELRAFLRPASDPGESPGSASPTMRPVAAGGAQPDGVPPAAAKNGGSSLDHAFADGKVEMVWTLPASKRTGHSEHAEYYVGENKVVLSGGEPDLSDTQRGITRGRQLTWFADTHRLIVTGAEAEQAHSLMKRK